MMESAGRLLMSSAETEVVIQGIVARPKPHHCEYAQSFQIPSTEFVFIENNANGQKCIKMMEIHALYTAFQTISKILDGMVLLEQYVSNLTIPERHAGNTSDS